MATFVLGDIHGQYNKLEKVLLHSRFNFNEDKLIFLGDVVDRGPAAFPAIELLLEIKNLVPLIGNHDLAFIRRISKGEDIFNGMYGSDSTFQEWNALNKAKQAKFWKYYLLRLKPFHIQDQNVFVHAGFDCHEPISQQGIDTLCWDSSLWRNAIMYTGKDKICPLYNEIFIGHTSTTYYNTTKPMHYSNVWLMDTGAGKGGVLTLMNVDTKEYWQA